MALEPESTSRRPISNAPDASALHGPADAFIDPRFEVLEALGAGASGSVYRARTKEPFADLGAGSDIAVKVLRPELRADPEARQRLAEEGRLGSAMNSPHVVQIHATDPDAALLVMELVPGQSLREFLVGSGSAVEELARRIGRDAARGLAALHRLGVVHRDVKPENLALTEAGEVKVMDLGLARRLRHRRRPGASGSAGSAGFYGSLAYAAPEVLKGRRASFQSDLYSLGVVLFEVTTGQHPFFANDRPIDHRDNEVVDDIIHAHINQQPPRPSHLKPRISAFLERLILDLLQKDPTLRPQSAGELAAAFEHGEGSRYWLRHERSAPTLASRRRLRAMRRPSDADFVGRRRELSQLDDLLRRAMDGRGAAVQISGPRGIGRRRLLDHFLERWLDRREDLAFLGAEAGYGHGLQRTAAFSHIVLEWFLGGEREDSPNAQARLAARIHDATELTEQEAVRVAAMACASDVDSSPEERADLIVRVVLSLASRRHTLILRIDRAEQISTTAQLVVQRLAERISEHRILLLLTSLRPEPPAPGFVNVPLHGLAQDEFLQLGGSLFRGGKAPPELLRDAHETLSGIPGHLLEALADLATRRMLAGRPGNYLLTDDVPELRPAGTLLDLLRSRMSELTAEQRHIHIAAAILGQQFTLSDLAALAGQPELAVLTGLSVFQGRVIVTRPGGGKFRHRDFRRAILDMVPPEARRRLHRSAAWVLEDRDAPRLDVGLHYSRAGEHDAAMDPLLDGLSQLVTAGSREQSQQVAERLQIHLDALPQKEANLDRRLRYLMLLGQIQLADRDERAARSTFQRAASLAEVRGAATERAEALVELGNLAMMLGKLAVAKKRLAAAEKLLREQQMAGNRMARCLTLQARVEGYLGQSEEALRLTQQALRTVDPDATGLIAHLHVDQARLEALRNHFRAAQKSLDHADELFQELGSAQGQLRVLLHRGHVRAHMGDRERATRMLQTAVERGHQLSDIRAQAKAMLFLGEQDLLWGDRHATAHLFDAVTLAKEPGDHMTRVLASLYLQQLGIDVGNLEHDVRQLAVPALKVVWLLNRAQELQRDTDEGSQQEARDLLAQAVRIEREITVPLHLHHRLLSAVGKQKRADHLVDDVAGRLSGSKRRRFLSFMRRVR